MTAPERVYWSMVPDDAPYEPMGGAWDKGVWWLSVDEPSATETLGIEKWRARGCEVVEYVPRALYDAAVAERDATVKLAEVRLAQFENERRAARLAEDALLKAVAERDEARAALKRAEAERDSWNPIVENADYWRDAAMEYAEGVERERDEAMRLHAEAVEARDEAMREAETLERQRDEARHERDVESRTRSELRYALKGVEGALCDASTVVTDPAEEGVRQLVAERDAARAEVERLRGPCTCGSGGHPRKCDAHPCAYEAHCAELSLESARAEVEAMRPVVEAAEAFDRFDVGDLEHGAALYWPARRAYDALEKAVTAYRAAKEVDDE